MSINNVVLNTGTLTPSRGSAWTMTLSALDAEGAIPTDAAAIQFVMYWRTVDGRLYASSASIVSNEFTLTVPKTYMNPATASVYLDTWWIMNDGTQQKFGSYNVSVQDIPNTITVSGASSTAPRPVLFYSAGMPVAGTTLGSVQFDPASFGGSGTLTLPVAGCKESAPPTGSGILLTLYAAGVATAYSWTIAAGASREAGTDSIAVTENTIYTIHVDTVGSTYAGEDVYMSFLFTPTA